MNEWLKISLVLCVFGFFRELRPSEPFVSEFLDGPWRNITQEQLNRDVYPIGTYSYLALLVIVFLITDILRYKIIIILSACIGVIIWSLLLWTKSLAALQVVQVFYGTFMAAEVAYYTYIYAKIHRDKYQKVTGHTRAAILSGRFTGSLMAQLLYSYGIMDLRDLNYITLGAQFLSLLWTFFLPPVGASLYFYVKDEVEAAGSGKQKHLKSENNFPNQSTATLTSSTGVGASNFSFNRAMGLLWDHFIAAYSNLTVVQWSLWWALAMAGFMQVQVYVQLLWQTIDPGDPEDEKHLFNGAVEATLTLFGAVSALVAGYIANKIFDNHGLWILTSCSLLQGVLVLYSGFTNNIWVAYAMYILFGILYMFMITIASASVARNLEDDSFALIFGINTCVALIFQTLLTVIVISEDGLALSTRGQFKVYGGYFIVLSLLYLATAIVQKVVTKRKIRT